MRNRVSRSIWAVFLTGFAGLMTHPAAWADGAGTSGGLILLEAAGARAAAVGEAFSTVSGDVAAMVYNPATLATLGDPQASVTYQTGISDDASGRLHLGRRNLGFSLSYYSAGEVDVPEGGGTRTIDAQTDLAATVAMSRTFGRIDCGGAAKYLSSKLAETDSASAFAVDLGMGLEIAPRLRIGSALQNIGTSLDYGDDADPLPRLLRFGASYRASLGQTPVTLSLEAPYHLNEKDWRPALGIEAHAGPLAFRAGYRNGSDIEGLSLGTGFSVGGLLIDYSFGFVDDLDDRQRVSLGYRFGAREKAPPSMTEGGQ